MKKPPSIEITMNGQTRTLYPGDRYLIDITASLELMGAMADWLTRIEDLLLDVKRRLSRRSAYVSQRRR